jgi:hypothetical protein
MSKGRALGVLAAATVAALSVAACGGSSNKDAKNASAIVSLLDPANKMPASVVAYASVVIKPGGSLKTNLVQTIDKLAGPGAANRLASGLTSKAGAEFKQFSAWANGTIGVALTAIPDGQLTQQALINNLLVVVPTSDPAAAKNQMSAHPGTTPGVTYEVDGNYAIAGGAAALAQEKSVTSANSLASDPGFTSTMTQVGGNQLGIVFVRPKPLLQGLLPLLAASGNSAQVTAAMQKIPEKSTAAFAATAGPNTLSFDAVTQGYPKSKSTSAPSDVASLPGSSWLALAIAGSLGNPKTISTLQKELPGLIDQAQSSAGPVGDSADGIIQFLELDLVPALGPMSLSVEGTSLGTLHAGFEMTPANPLAGPVLVSQLKNLLKGLPVDVSSVGNKVVATFGYTDAQDFLSPSSKLSGDPTYKAALAQMPPGSQVPIYLDFGPIATLGSALDTKQSDASAWKIVKRLNYLIAGGTSTHIRVVLAVK